MVNKKKHIVINAIHCKTGGGLVFFNHIVKLLALEKSFKLTVITHVNNEAHLDIPKNVNLHKVDFPEVFLKTLVWEQIKLPGIVKNIGGDVTFNMANYGPIFAPKPVVYVTNNPEVRHYVSSISEKLYWHALIWMTRLSLMFSPKSFSNGHYMKDVYAGGIFKFLQKKMVRATTACDLNSKKKVSKTKGQLIAIGDFYAQKKYGTLIKAFSIVKKKNVKAKLIIVGRPINESIDNELKYWVDIYGLQDSVIFKGAMPHDETKELLAKSEVYVSPSDAEAFSLTLLEAMTLGTASVVKNHAFQREVAEEKGAEYVELTASKKEEYELFAEGILNVLDNAKHRKALVEEGLKLSKNYSWKNTAKIITDTLKEI